MITVTRITDVAPGRGDEAVAYARKLATHLRTHHQVRIEVLRPIGGAPQRICWMSHFDDLAAFGAFGERLSGDERYWEIVSGAAECFVAGAGQDEIWHSI